MEHGLKASDKIDALTYDIRHKTNTHKIKDEYIRYIVDGLCQIDAIREFLDSEIEELNKRLTALEIKYGLIPNETTEGPDQNSV